MSSERSPRATQAVRPARRERAPLLALGTLAGAAGGFLVAAPGLLALPLWLGLLIVFGGTVIAGLAGFVLAALLHRFIPAPTPVLIALIAAAGYVLTWAGDPLWSALTPDALTALEHYGDGCLLPTEFALSHDPMPTLLLPSDEGQVLITSHTGKTLTFTYQAGLLARVVPADSATSTTLVALGCR